MTYPPQQPYGRQFGEPHYGKQAFDQYGQPYYGGPPPPPEKNTRLIIGVVVAVVGLLGGAAGLFFALRGGAPTAAGGPSTSTSSSRPSGDPEQIAKKFGSIVEDQMHRGTTDLSELEDVSCANDLKTAREKDFKIATKPRAKATITVEDVQTQGDTGTFTMTYANPSGSTATRKPDSEVLKAELVTEGGAWRVCNVFTPRPSASSSTRPSR